MPFFASHKGKLALHRFIRLRHRYIYTRHQKIRLRYALGSFLLISSVLASGYQALSNLSGGVGAVDIAQNESPLDDADPAFLSDLAPSAGAFDVLKEGVSSGIRKASLAIKKSEKPRFREVELGDGDTVAGLLQDAGLNDSDTYYAVKALGKYVDVRKVKSGQKIGLHFRNGGDGNFQLSKMEMEIDPLKQVRLVRRGGDAFEGELLKKDLVAKTYARKAKIQNSLYGSAARANIPSAIVAEVIKVYSQNVDFQRDIQPGDSLEVMYAGNETEDGEYARSGDLLYANLSIGGKTIPIYRYETQSGMVDYFGPDGMSTRKTLMKTPVDGARISSGFGMRRHPVLGYSKMHKGMDFAAPTGTPIYASGNGTVEYAGRFSSYGNYVRIRHNSTLKTAYAHMHKIVSGVRVGKRVKQGQIIGYVGTTGRSTGPHLHYEVMVRNKQVNPKSIDLPTGEQLGGKDLKRFKSMMNNIRAQYVSLEQGKFAENDKALDASDTTIRVR